MQRKESLEVCPEQGDSEDDGRTKPSKITEDSIIRALLFAFFGHKKEYESISEQRNARNFAKEQLIVILRTIFNAVKNSDFPRERHGWLSDELIEEHFRNRNFHQFNRYIDAERLPFQEQRSAQQRFIFAAIAAVGRSAFNHAVQEEYKYASEVSRIVDIAENEKYYYKQINILGDIERELKNVEARPRGAITFDSKNNIIFKISDSKYYPTLRKTKRDGQAIIGKYIVFRKMLTSMGQGLDYIREYLVIESKPYGLIFRWESRGTKKDIEIIFEGVVLIVEDAFWLMGFSTEPFHHVRIMACSTLEWERNAKGWAKEIFNTGKMLSHRKFEEAVEPASADVVLLREVHGDWNVESIHERVIYMTAEEIKKMLIEYPEAIKVIL